MSQKANIIIKEFFDRGIWRLIWKNARTFRLRWRLGRRYLRIKRYRDALNTESLVSAKEIALRGLNA